MSSPTPGESRTLIRRQSEISSSSGAGGAVGRLLALLSNDSEHPSCPRHEGKLKRKKKKKMGKTWEARSYELKDNCLFTRSQTMKDTMVECFDLVQFSVVGFEKKGGKFTGCGFELKQTTGPAVADERLLFLANTPADCTLWMQRLTESQRKWRETERAKQPLGSDGEMIQRRSSDTRSRQPSRVEDWMTRPRLDTTATSNTITEGSEDESEMTIPPLVAGLLEHCQNEMDEMMTELEISREAWKHKDVLLCAETFYPPMPSQAQTLASVLAVGESLGTEVLARRQAEDELLSRVIADEMDQERALEALQADPDSLAAGSLNAEVPIGKLLVAWADERSQLMRERDTAREEALEKVAAVAELQSEIESISNNLTKRTSEFVEVESARRTLEQTNATLTSQLAELAQDVVVTNPSHDQHGDECEPDKPELHDAQHEIAALRDAERHTRAKLVAEELARQELEERVAVITASVREADTQVAGLRAENEALRTALASGSATGGSVTGGGGGGGGGSETGELPLSITPTQIPGSVDSSRRSSQGLVVPPQEHFLDLGRELAETKARLTEALKLARYRDQSGAGSGVDIATTRALDDARQARTMLAAELCLARTELMTVKRNLEESAAEASAANTRASLSQMRAESAQCRLDATQQTVRELQQSRASLERRCESLSSEMAELRQTVGTVVKNASQTRTSSRERTLLSLESRISISSRLQEALLAVDAMLTQPIMLNGSQVVGVGMLGSVRDMLGSLIIQVVSQDDGDNVGVTDHDMARASSSHQSSSRIPSVVTTPALSPQSQSFSRTSLGAPLATTQESHRHVSSQRHQNLDTMQSPARFTRSQLSDPTPASSSPRQSCSSRQGDGVRAKLPTHLTNLSPKRPLLSLAVACDRKPGERVDTYST